MVRIIKIDGVNSFFVDSSTLETFDTFQKNNLNLSLSTKLEDGSVLTVSNEKLKYNKGRITFDYGQDRFIIDDGYQNILIRAGYIVMDQYDQERILNYHDGNKIREELLERICSYLDTIYVYDIDNSLRSEIYKYNTNGYEYTICIDTSESLVDKNLKRKENGLPFYPFIKSMDKYGTVYLSIFCKKLESNTKPDTDKKYSIGDVIIDDMIKDMNENDPDHEYHFSRVIVKKKIIED